MEAYLEEKHLCCAETVNIYYHHFLTISLLAVDKKSNISTVVEQETSPDTLGRL